MSFSQLGNDANMILNEAQMSLTVESPIQYSMNGHLSKSNQHFDSSVNEQWNLIAPMVRCM